MAKMTFEQFVDQAAYFYDVFVEELEKILEGEEGLDEVGLDDDTNIFSGRGATVDSKAVVQLNPVAEEELDIDLDPEDWITPGGFETVEDAVSSLIDAIKKVLKP